MKLLDPVHAGAPDDAARPMPPRAEGPVGMRGGKPSFNARMHLYVAAVIAAGLVVIGLSVQRVDFSQPLLLL
ncbi:MAG: hypothetical protein EHM24_01720, partial [Acidobacteria bacterium]